MVVLLPCSRDAVSSIAISAAAQDLLRPLIRRFLPGRSDRLTGQTTSPACAGGSLPPGSWRARSVGLLEVSRTDRIAAARQEFRVLPSSGTGSKAPPIGPSWHRGDKRVCHVCPRTLRRTTRLESLAICDRPFRSPASTSR